jgi:hypothetical protein
MRPGPPHTRLLDQGDRGPSILGLLLCAPRPPLPPHSPCHAGGDLHVISVATISTRRRRLQLVVELGLGAAVGRCNDLDQAQTVATPLSTLPIAPHFTALRQAAPSDSPLAGRLALQIGPQNEVGS